MLRSIFITLYVIYLLVGSVLSVAGYIKTPGHVGWYASIVVHMIGVIWFSYIYLSKLKSAHLISLVVTTSTGAGALIAGGHYLIVDSSIQLPVILSFIAFGFWGVYNFLYAKMSKKIGLTIGSSLPSGTFTKADGSSITTDQLSKNSMIIFHRGSWCPFCNEQLDDFSKDVASFEEKGVKLYAISTQPIKERWTGIITELQDQDGVYANTLGILHKSTLPFGLSVLGYKTDLPAPLAILTDNDSKVKAIHKTDDYRRRPDTGYFLRYLK
ncbi:redoxin domain-containing protein [Sanyastnella coralliicola]|uniref:redoxin domain-containing protein n=1 Tax=Sanyastnella coralliicola TaxID=3069118 RepID=UPI0027B9E4E6|nr:redoxin domain-containing protein [Longitalea sp. SCSIO 12813]